MNRITFRSLLAVPALLVLLCVPSVASADGITWTLSGVTFDDGGTASGSFVYDAVTNTVSSINIVTTAGPHRSEETHTRPWTLALVPRSPMTSPLCPTLRVILRVP